VRWWLLLLLPSCSRERSEVHPDPAPPRATIEVPVPVPVPPKPPEPPPPPPPPPPKFDNAAARTALAGIGFKHCALDRSARVLIRFHPAGNATVDRIATEDPLPSDVDLCLVKAFEKARVPLFVGEPVSIAFLVK
jgi:hypothetical protein